MKNSENIIAGRHLEDVNDLRNGLDTELKKEQGDEVIRNIKKLSLEIIKNTRSKGKQNILLVHSSKKRASQTCEILKEIINKEEYE